MSWNKQRRLEDAAMRVDFEAMQLEMLTPECLGVVSFEEAGRDAHGRRILRFAGAMLVEDDTPLKAATKYVLGGSSNRTSVSLTVAL